MITMFVYKVHGIILTNKPVKSFLLQPTFKHLHNHLLTIHSLLVLAHRSYNFLETIEAVEDPMPDLGEITLSYVNIEKVSRKTHPTICSSMLLITSACVV